MSGLITPLVLSSGILTQLPAGQQVDPSFIPRPAIQHQVFTSSGNFTVPAGVTVVIVEVWGAGGGGSAAGSTATAGAGGGYAKKRITGLVPGAIIAVTIGAAGLAGTSGNGGNGGNSSFGAYCSATGGAGGSNSSGLPSAGGIGASGDFNCSGGQGSPLNFRASYAPGGGAPCGGPGGVSGVGSLPGGGGGTSNSGVNGAGAPGLIVVQW